MILGVTQGSFWHLQDVDLSLRPSSHANKAADGAPQRHAGRDFLV